MFLKLCQVERYGYRRLIVKFLSRVSLESGCALDVFKTLEGTAEFNFQSQIKHTQCFGVEVAGASFFLYVDRGTGFK